jgi:hypothetical protein
MLDQRLLLCQYQYVCLLKFKFYAQMAFAL